MLHLLKQEAQLSVDDKDDDDNNEFHIFFVYSVW